MIDTPIAPARRIGWIDYAKVLAILSVVLIHTHCQYELTVALKAFTMPVFFFLSGYLFARERNPRFGEFAYKRFRQLVVPYVWINLVAYLVWVFFLRHYGDDAASPLAWHEPLVAMALGLPPGLVHDIPLWSLLCFFVVEMIYYPLSGRGRFGDLWLAVLAFVVASAVSLAAGDEGVVLPLALAPCATALLFYALGHYAREHREQFVWLTRPGILVLLAGIALWQIGVALNTPVNFFVGHLGNPLWFACGAIGGVIMVVQIAAFFDHVAGDGRFVRFVSRGTLIICGFHILAFAFIKGVLYFGLKIDPWELTAGPVRGFCMAVTAFALCLPLIWAIERYARFLVNK